MGKRYVPFWQSHRGNKSKKIRKQKMLFKERNKIKNKINYGEKSDSLFY